MTSAAARCFPPIEDYALIGDCRTAALVARDGSIEWLCFPDFHCDSVFASMLDRRRGGHLKIAPPEVESCKRHYLDETNILVSNFTGSGGSMKVIDFLPVNENDSATLDPERELLRIIEATDGEPEVRIDFAPAPDYGRRKIRLEKRGKIGWAIDSPGELYLLRSDIDLKHDGEGRLVGNARLKPGERRYVSFSFVSRDPAIIPLLGEQTDEKLARTRNWWCGWSAQCSYEGPYRDYVLRSALALKSLQFCLSGAVIAAATSSLPEAIGAERNWDYRYCWLRDAAFTLRAFIDSGFESEGAAFFDWFMHSTRLTQPKLQTMYDLYGRTDLGERKLPHLSGYRDSRPVRVGNAAHDQLQLDIYGSVISAAALFVDRGNDLDSSERRLLRRLGETVCNLWREPDNGIWEFRHARQHNTWSKVMCWSALDNLLHLDKEQLITVPRDYFEQERRAIGEAVQARSFSEKRKCFVGAFDGEYLDATALLFPRTGIIAADDPRMLSTWEQIMEKLSDGPLIRRYEDGADNLSGSEGSFVICSFWAVEYLARAGHLDEARERMQALLNYTNDVGLLSEEIDHRDGTMLGNFPQAFSHTGLIDAAFAIANAEKQRETGRSPS